LSLEKVHGGGRARALDRPAGSIGAQGNATDERSSARPHQAAAIGTHESRAQDEAIDRRGSRERGLARHRVGDPAGIGDAGPAQRPRLAHHGLERQGSHRVAVCRRARQERQRIVHSLALEDLAHALALGSSTAVSARASSDCAAASARSAWGSSAIARAASVGFRAAREVGERAQSRTSVRTRWISALVASNAGNSASRSTSTGTGPRIATSAARSSSTGAPTSAACVS
jgi:hypothetical protein